MVRDPAAYDNWLNVGDNSTAVKILKIKGRPSVLWVCSRGTTSVWSTAVAESTGSAP